MAELRWVTKKKKKIFPQMKKKQNKSTQNHLYK